jgi:hypothetical protein
LSGRSLIRHQTSRDEKHDQEDRHERGDRHDEQIGSGVLLDVFVV